ncbi:MAG TPA: hypothetical protein PLZ94_05655 [Armatimonadota bacterium]|jgi:hypothetical protein|nr:hypothetical protein [Armatimonadota bacterium]
MTIRIVLTLALALAVTLPAAAQQGASDQNTGTMPSATTTMSADTFRQGAFVSYQAATADRPGSVTLRFNWQGMDILGTYEVQPGQSWMVNGRQVNLSTVAKNTMVTIPQDARLTHLTFGGTVGVGTITAMNPTQRTLTVRLPSGETRMIRHAENLLVVRNGQIMSVTQLAPGQTVLFEVPPDGNQVVILREVGTGTIATVTDVTDDSVTLRFAQAGQQMTRTYPLDEGIIVFHQGRMVDVEDVEDRLATNQQVWIFGPIDNPHLVVSQPTMGFETAVVTIEETEVATVPTTPEMPVAVQAMAPPFNEGTFVSYSPATDTMPALATFRFNWQGTPLLGTFMVREEDRFLSDGQLVNLADLEEGAMVTVPQGARLANLTFGGNVGIGTISSVDRSRNTVSVRLPNGETRTLRYSPEAIFLENGQPASIAELDTGQTVLFEVVPQRNVVGIFTPVGEGMQATVTQITDEGITVRYVMNGQMVTRTLTSDEVAFVNRGQAVSDLAGAYRVGQTVWIYGPADNPQLVAGGVNMGFETAVVTQPSPAVAGVREEPAAAPAQPARPVIRGRW